MLFLSVIRMQTRLRKPLLNTFCSNMNTILFSSTPNQEHLHDDNSDTSVSDIDSQRLYLRSCIKLIRYFDISSFKLTFNHCRNYRSMVSYYFVDRTCRKPFFTYRSCRTLSVLSKECVRLSFRCL